MDIFNLHEHQLKYEKYDVENSLDKFYRKLKRKECKNYIISNNKCQNLIEDKYLFYFTCEECEEFYNDYNNSYERNNSFFSLKNNKNKYELEEALNIKIFEFVELDNMILIGTKNEIISHISQKYNELNIKSHNKMKVLYSTIKKKEEEFSQFQNQEKKEKEEREKCINEKEKQIQNLANNNKNLEVKNKELESKLEILTKENKKNISQLNNEKQSKKDLELKFSEFQNQEKKNKQEREKYINEKEKQIQNLANNNKNLEVKNKELEYKYDNIIKENSKNINELLSRVKKEEQSKNDLKLKLSELQEQERKIGIKNEELEERLKNKDEELKKNESFGLKFESDTKSGDYDIILDITSFQDLVTKGWKIKYNKKEGKAQYLKKKDEPTIIVGVIGNGNKGKSFFLEKLSGYDIPKGFNIKTEGLSIRYASSQEHNIAILDSAGQETPLLKVAIDKNENIKEGNVCSNNNKEINDTSNANSKPRENGDSKEVNNMQCNPQKEENKSNENIENNNSQKNNNTEDEDIEFEKYSRDKLITEFFLQKFIIWKSDILILVVGNISLTEQKLLSRVKAEVESMDKNKQIYVIHNLKDYSTEEQVNDYIENTLKKLYKIEIEEILRQELLKDKENKNNCFNKYFVEKGKKVIHLIFINEFSERANYYNPPTIEFIQKEIEVIKTRSRFSIIDDCKNFFVKISEEIMEGNPKLENLVTEEGDKDKPDKIVLKNMKGIILKKFVVDEMGYTLNNDSNTPKYSYYIDTDEKILYINIELPGGGSIEPNVEIVPGYYIFIFQGEKKGDIAIEEDKKKEIGKLIQKKNLRKSNKFKLEIKIPNSIIQIKLEDGEDLSDAGEFEDNGKGVYSFKYKVLILNQKNEKTKKKKKIEL